MIKIQANNNQEAFDIAATEIRKQGMPATKDRSTTCVYIGELDGKTVSCGVGHLFTEDDRRFLQKVGKNTEGIDTLILDELVSCHGVSQALLSDIQEAHDESVSAAARLDYTALDKDKFITEFIAHMGLIAGLYELDRGALYRDLE